MGDSSKTESWSHRIVRWTQAHQQEMEALYRTLHDKAEISWQEYRTTEHIQQLLTELGLDVYLFPNHTGAWGRWKGKAHGRIVAIRADMDALWQHVEGEWKANHSCGHDAHMTMAFSALWCLREIGFHPEQGEIRVIFQPAEETAYGALRLLDSGLLDDVDLLLGIHLRPAKELAVGQASSAIYHSGAACLQFQLQGRQSHASRPEDGINVLEAFAGMIVAIGEAARDFIPGNSCKVTTAEVPNTSSNIIPDRMTCKLDLRASSAGEMDRMILQVQEAALQAVRTYGAQAEMSVLHRTEPALPNKWMEEQVGRAIADVLGPAGLAAPVRTPGAEDFHFYAHRKPSLQATMVGLGCGLTPGLHHPQMRFELEALSTGTAILAQSIVRLFEEPEATRR